MQSPKRWLQVYDPWPWNADILPGGCGGLGGLGRSQPHEFHLCTTCLIGRPKLVDADIARAAARREGKTGPYEDDPQFRTWRSAVPGEPQLVHDPRGQPAYWLVPVQCQGTTIGAIRVLASGRAAALIAYRAGSDLLALNPSQILEQAGVRHRRRSRQARWRGAFGPRWFASTGGVAGRGATR
jgi:hypothetical protein